MQIKNIFLSLLVLCIGVFADECQVVLTSDTTAANGERALAFDWRDASNVTIRSSSGTLRVGATDKEVDAYLDYELTKCVSTRPPATRKTQAVMKVDSTDPRLSDSRTPKVHTHPESEVTNLTADLAARSLKIASGTATFATTAVAASACSATVTVAAAGVVSTDVISWSYQAQPAAATNGKLTMHMWPTANAVNFCRQNNTAASVTPTAITINWQVIR